jgi:arylsulfatase A-like enzyme
VPFIIKNLHQQASGTTNHTPVMSIDLFPTLMDLAGVKVDKVVKNGFDGISLKPLLADKKKQLKRSSIFWHYPHYHSEGATPYSAVRHGDWKLIHIIETNTYELYNLKEDIGEKKDQASLYPKVVKQLARELEKWKKDMNAQMPLVKK